MKDLELKDILERQVESFTKISVYLNGQWQFATLVNPIAVDNNQSFYRIDYKFGLAKSSQENPKKFSLFGNPGDYVAIDNVGIYSLVKKDQYKQLFNSKSIGQSSVVPTQTSTNATPTTSASLKNPNYITEVVKGLAPKTSNSTTVQKTQDKPKQSYTPKQKASKPAGGSTCTNCGGY